MFGLFKKRIPAPEHERALLVRRMFLERSQNDPGAEMMAMMTGTRPQEIPPEMLMQGAPEATILRVVEQFLQMKDAIQTVTSWGFDVEVSGVYVGDDWKVRSFQG